MRVSHSIRKILILILFFHGLLGYSQKSYTPNTLLRTQIRKDIWKELKLKTPQKHRFMTGLVFNSNECFGLYEKAAKKYGWKPYELHTAAAFYKIILEEVIAKRSYTDDEVKTIYNKIKANYLKSKTDFALKNELLQQKYDPLVIEALWINTVFQLSKKNNQEIEKLAKTLLENFENIPSSAVQTENNSPENKISVKQKTSNKNNTSYSANSKISEIILRTATKYGLNGVYVANDVSVLYSNGDIFTNPSKPLEGLNITGSKSKNPKKWRTWKKQGGILYITDPRKRKTYNWKKWFKVRSGTKGFKLSGKFNTSDGFGGATVINASTVVFDRQGRFAWKTVKGGNTDWKAIFSKSSSAGTYKIEDYTITLKYNNGVEEAFFFGLYPKDDQHFIIGSSHFVPVKNN
ncbi:hypothetical protein MTsPCn9_02490 [Croceitalea sp. MTPC9]|uniref:hypothetical protein n=1 Tax=unclassified Croceitalea TaxID=2632280 RepID=UPI002B3A624E|nr:hypothetical protein MTsPCn6_06220 [Croceitalea sp. MTPC6]GMN15313.1 hypothetical protein MTsPCn9_02490 [Croceitalea sp. MTPC9]